MLHAVVPFSAAAIITFSLLVDLPAADTSAPEGFTSLFNGKDLTGWKVPDGDNGHWKVVDGVIDYDAKSEAKGDKSPVAREVVQGFRPARRLAAEDRSGLQEQGAGHPARRQQPEGRDGKEISVEIDDVDSGIYLRGSGKAQVNIWMWPIGSGEVYGYRMDKKMPPEVRAGVTPKKNAGQAARRVEHVRDHDEGRPAVGEAERRGGHQQRPAARRSARGPDRAAAPRQLERQDQALDRPAQPGAVPQYLHQGIEIEAHRSTQTQASVKPHTCLPCVLSRRNQLVQRVRKLAAGLGWLPGLLDLSSRQVRIEMQPKQGPAFGR